MDEQKVAKCITILEKEYGVPGPEAIDPVDLLVMTILSQNTSDNHTRRSLQWERGALAF